MTPGRRWTARAWLCATLGAAGWWSVSCRELPTPAGGVLSLGPVLLPSPGVVAGDTMRDSTGAVAPLRVVAYSVNGDTVQNAVVTFVVVDTAPGSHLAGPLLIGDVAGKTDSVLGSVESVQTRPVPVRVTLSPDTLVTTDSVVQRRTYRLTSGDSVVDATLSQTVLHGAGAAASGVEAVVVRYAIERMTRPGVNNASMLLLVNGPAPSLRDTSDAQGRVARTARYRAIVSADTLADTAVVSATASYRGRTIGRILYLLVYTGTAAP